MNKNYFVAIMAGGVGSRFWPSSREERPKQFLDILGLGKSLIRLTYERFLKVCPPENIYVVTNKSYAGQVLEHIPELTKQQVLCEPSRNNTAPCVAYTALRIKAVNPSASFVIAPSDALILKEDLFAEKIVKALEFVDKEDAIVTLGIEPSRPDTGYGYIQYKESETGIFPVKRFTEKPDVNTAQKFLDSGDYLWNAGIFVWGVQTILKAFAEHSNDILTILDKEGVYNTDKEEAFLAENYPNCEKISVDYAIMEKANNIHTIPADIGWTDLGTWASLHVQAEKDKNNNVSLGGSLMIEDVENSLIRLPKGKLAVIRGLKDFIVVDEEDVLLIYPKSEEQAIKAVRKKVEKKTGNQYL